MRFFKCDRCGKECPMEDLKDLMDIEGISIYSSEKIDVCDKCWDEARILLEIWWHKEKA